MFGDIRRFPRLDSLEQDIEDRIKEEIDEPVAVERLIVFGSWGRGKAKVFRSDLDVLAVISNPKGNNLDPQFDLAVEMAQMSLLDDEALDSRYAAFDGTDIIVRKSTTNVEEIMKAQLSEVQPALLFDLTERKDIEYVDGKLVRS